jgi:cytochrome P450
MDRFTRRDNPSSGLSGIQETDILTKLLQLQSEKGVLTDHWVRKMTMANFGAGIDTTAATISVLINNIARRPGLQERVHREIVAARKGGKLSNPPKLGEMKHHLPFLSACLKESIRLSPIIGMPLVRIVPKSGLEIEGYYLPPGVRTLSPSPPSWEAKCFRFETLTPTDYRWHEPMGSQQRRISIRR